MERKWLKEPLDEQLLQRLKVKQHYEEWIPFAEVSIEASIRANTRPGHMRDEMILDYTSDMAAGIAFPMPVYTIKTARGFRDILSGVHRTLTAQQLGDSGAPALIAHTSEPAMIEALRCLFNDQNGRPEAPALKMASAVHQVIYHGLKRKDVACTYNLSPSTLGKHIKAEKCRMQLQQQGIRVSIPQDVLLEISREEAFPAVVEGLGKLYQSHRPTTEQMAEIVEKLKTEPTPARKLGVITSQGELLGWTKDSGTFWRNPTKIKLVDSLQRLHNLAVKYPSLACMDINHEDDIQLIGDLWKKTAQEMYRLINSRKGPGDR